MAFSFLVYFECSDFRVISRFQWLEKPHHTPIIITITGIFVLSTDGFSLSSVNMATKCALVNRHANLVEFTKPFYIHSNQRVHLHGLPIRVRLISKMQLVDNCRYHSCRCRVNWDHVLHIDSPHILDKQMRYSTKQLMQGWWTETVNEQIQNTIS